MEWPMELEHVGTVEPGRPDDALILAASYEDRCLGLARRLRDYSCARVILTVYDGESERRRRNIKELEQLLCSAGELVKLPAHHDKPLDHVRALVDMIRACSADREPRLSIDVSTFTKNHLLLLLQGLHLADMLRMCHIYYTEPTDFHTYDNQPLSLGVASVGVVDTFVGAHTPSKETLLVLFLGYEGTRALALWQHLEPNETIAVIPDPPYRDTWRGRTEAQNGYLLSLLPPECKVTSHSLLPADTLRLLTDIVDGGHYPPKKYNYVMAPVGTKAQTVGLFRFCRERPGIATVMYAAPVRHKEEEATFPAGRTWLIDRTELWGACSDAAGSSNTE
jgi:hypothetical protein